MDEFPNPYSGNPFTAPQTGPGQIPQGPQGPPGPNSDPDAIRLYYLKHEASLQSMALLYMVGGLISLLLGAFLFYLVVSYNGADGREIPAQVDEALVQTRLIPILLVVLGLAQLVIGWWLRILHPSSKWPATALSAIGLMGFPMGTLINGAILYLIHCKKGQVVLSEEYQEIRAVTPHIRYRTPVVLRILGWLLVVVVLLVVFAVVVPLLQNM